MATIKFNDFAERYCGTANREEQIPILLDALIYDVEDGTNELDEKELLDLYEQDKVQIEQTYFEPNGYYDIIINRKYYCASIKKII